MAEIVTLTTPVAKASKTGETLDRITFDVTQKSITVQWLGTDGTPGSAVYPTPAILNPLGALQPTGAALLTTVNTGNNTVTSMIKKIWQRLQTDGYVLAGAISGTPD